MAQCALPPKGQRGVLPLAKTHSLDAAKGHGMVTYIQELHTAKFMLGGVNIPCMYMF